MIDKLHGYIGLAKRAGKLISGSGGVEDAVRQHKAVVVVLAEDASGNTTKRITDKCRFYQTKVLTCSTKKDLGRAIGTGDASCVAVTDRQLAQAMIRVFEEIYGGGNIW